MQEKKKKSCLSLKSSFPELYIFKGKHSDRLRITSQDALRVKFNPVSSNTLDKMKCKMYRFLSLNLMSYLIPEVLR